MTALSEFELIARYLRRDGTRRADVVLGNGDDAAIVRVPPEYDLVVSTDSLVAGVHFPPDFNPVDLGYRSLAVNLSDLAATGATPAWAVLALTLPRADDAWVRDFAGGFFELADAQGLELVGGNVSRGPLSITVTVHGQVPKGQGLRRSGARAGDLVAVSGTLGDARLALDYLARMDDLPEDSRSYLYRRFARPTPRLALGRAMRALATSCIDLSDGLAADLSHVLQASGVGADISVEKLPLSPVLTGLADVGTVHSHALGGGDDYELCFTLPPAYADRAAAIATQTACPLTTIGQVREGTGLRILARDGSELALSASGYRHF